MLPNKLIIRVKIRIKANECAIILNEFCSILEYMKHVILARNCHGCSTRKHKFHVTFPFMRRTEMCDKKV